MNGVNNNKPFALTPTHVMGILKQLEQGPTSWHTITQAQTYYNATTSPDSSTFEYWPNDSAKVSCYDSCGNGHRRRYASNEWPFSWEHSRLIADCDGTIIDGSQGCSLNHIGCPLRAHLYTSYIFDHTNPSHAVLKVDYLKNPQDYPAITALLLLLSNPNAPYLASFAPGYLPGVDSQGKSSANATCTFWPANGGEETSIAPAYCQFKSSDSSLTCLSNMEGQGCAIETAPATLWLACPLTLSIKTGSTNPTTNQAVGTFYCPSK